MEEDMVTVPRSVLEPFARLRLSFECEATTCLYRTPAEDMRHRAKMIEQRDAEIQALRNALIPLPSAPGKV